jgi:hypothetical protein
MEQPNQEKNKPESVTRLTHDALHDLIHFDSKFFRTLPPLFFKPGYLTEHALKNNEQKYVKPFALFVFLNFIFFIFKYGGLFTYSIDGYRSNSAMMNYFAKKQIGLHLSTVIMEDRFNTAMHFEQKEYFVIMIPIFALILQFLFFFKRRAYAEHLVFSLYFYSFFIVYLMLIPYLAIPIFWLLQNLGIAINVLNSEAALAILVLLINLVYLSFAARRIYKENYFSTIVKSAVLSIAVYLLIAYVYRNALFFIVLHSLSE